MNDFRLTPEHGVLCHDAFGFGLLPPALLQWRQEGAASLLAGGVRSWLSTQSPLTPRGIPTLVWVVVSGVLSHQYTSMDTSLL